jgi:hypothetical protein
MGGILMEKEPFYPYDFPKHICDKCEIKYDWEKVIEVIAKDGEVFSGHEVCMHIIYAKLKELDRL